MQYQVRKDPDGWYINQGIRRYLTRQDAESVASALSVKFILGESDYEVHAALTVMAIAEKGTSR